MGDRVLVIDDSATIRKLVSSILARHGYVPIVAQDGRSGLEKLRSSEVALVLLDYSMPRMNAPQFCAAIRHDPRLREIPVVLMSAREAFCEEMVRRGDATAAITKPFAPDALIETIEGALLEEITAELDESDLVEVSEARRRSDLEPGEPNRRGVARALARIVAAPLAELSDRVRGDLQVIEAVLSRALGDEELASLREALGAERADEASEPALAGDIQTIALGEILQVLHFQRQTGLLSIRSGEAEVVVYLREGLVDLVQGRGMPSKLRFGRYFVEEGLISREELEAVLRDKSPSKLMGELLVEVGVVQEEAVRKMLRRQSSELIYEILRWQKGRFSFSHRPFPPEATDARLGLPIASVVMEGFRRIDEWQLMEESFDFDGVLLKDDVALDALEPGKLSRRQELILAGIDGESTAREIVDRLEVCPFDAYKVLFELLRSRLVRKRAA